MSPRTKDGLRLGRGATVERRTATERCSDPGVLLTLGTGTHAAVV
jgi:hypothetical protein